MSRSHSSRREFLAVAAGAAFVRPVSLHAADDPRLAQVLARTIAVDMHSHVNIPFNRKDAPLPTFDLAAEMKRSGFSAVIQTYEVDSIPGGPAQDYMHNGEALDYEDRLLAAAKIRRALTLKDLENGHAQHQPMVIQSAEGAQFLEGHIERIEEVYKRGLRNLQPVHERDDATKPMADVYTRPANFGGLTDFGKEVVRACNRLGIVLDLTHMSYEAVKAALKISSHPMIFSHTAALAGPGDKPDPGMAPRLLSKEEMRDIAGGGGLVGVWFRGTDTAKDYVTAIKRIVDVIGVDHVGIGTDTILEPKIQRATNELWKGETRGFFPAVAAEMLQAGFKPEDVIKIGGGNFGRVFGKVTSRG